MKTFYSSILLALSLASVNAQDAGFRVPEAVKSSRAATQTGSVNAGAAVLTSMDVLDNNRPISVGDTISIKSKTTEALLKYFKLECIITKIFFNHYYKLGTSLI